MNGESARMRIGYLALEAPREGQASYAHVFELCAGLRNLGMEVDLYIPRYTNRPGRPGVVRRLWEYLWLQWMLVSKWKAFDLIYVRAHNMVFPVALLARMTGKPIVHEVNGPFLDIVVTYPWLRFFAPLINWLQLSQYAWANSLITVTPQLRDWLVGLGCHQDIEVIPNGANLDLFNPQRDRYSGLPSCYVVFFGGFARWQGISTMIAAAADPLWPRDASLVFVGDGQLSQEVRFAARSQDNVVYLGRLPYREVGAVVAGALAGLVPKSRQDDADNTGLFPIKLFEVLASGVPAIVSDYPGQADLVRAGECGLVIPPDDPAALARAVATLAADRRAASEMGQRGHVLIAREHSWAARAQQTAACIARTVRKA